MVRQPRPYHPSTAGPGVALYHRAARLDGQTRRPERSSAVENKSYRREDHSRRGDIQHDAIQRIAGLRQAISRRGHLAERETSHRGKLGVDVFVEIDDVPDGRNQKRSHDQPGPMSTKSRECPVSRSSLVMHLPHA